MNMNKYSDVLLDRARNPSSVGSMDEADPNVGTGLVGAPACGDVMKVQIKIENGIIVDASTKVFGCASAIASSSLAADMLKGRTIEEASGIKNTFIAEKLSLPPIKMHCSILAEEGIKAAIKDYYHKNPQAVVGEIDSMSEA